jgi:hypothetical protein
MNRSCYKSCLTSQRLRRGTQLSVLALAVRAVNASYAWTAESAQDPLTRQERCLLRSDTQNLQDGYGETPVTLVFNGEALLVVTTSEIDPGFSDLEIVIDDKVSFKTVKVTKKTIVLFDSELPSLVEQFKAGSWTTVYLRFWPTWPATQRFPAKFTLKGFTRAYSDFERCRQGRSQTNQAIGSIVEELPTGSSIGIVSTVSATGE